MRRSRLSDRGLTIRTILKNTPRYIFNTSEHVKVKQLQLTKDGSQARSITLTEVLGERPRKHIQEIILVSGDSFKQPRARIALSCDCEFFLYTCEVALYRYGAASIKYSNGEFPYSTNPRGIPCCCKHGIILFRALGIV